MGQEGAHLKTRAHTRTPPRRSMDSGVKLPTRPPSGVRMAGVEFRSLARPDSDVLLSWGRSTINRSGFPRHRRFSAHVTQYTIAPLIHRPQVLPSGDAGTRCPEGEMT